MSLPSFACIGALSAAAAARPRARRRRRGRRHCATGPREGFLLWEGERVNFTDVGCLDPVHQVRITGRLGRYPVVAGLFEPSSTGIVRTIGG